MRPPSDMPQPRRPRRPRTDGSNRGRTILIVVAIALFFLITSLRGIAGFYTDYLWFDSLGYDGVWFAILVVKMIELGLITPPVGINVYVVAGASPDLTVEDAFKGVLWFGAVDAMTIAVLFAFPALVTYLPGLIG